MRFIGSPPALTGENDSHIGWTSLLGAGHLGTSLTPILDYFAIRHAEQRVSRGMEEVDASVSPSQVILHGDRCSFSDRIIGARSPKARRLNAAVKMSKALRFIVGPEYLAEPLSLNAPDGIWVVETHCALKQSAKSLIGNLKAAGFVFGRDLSIEGLTAVELKPSAAR